MNAFHLGISKNDLKSATLAILPGNPERVQKIAEQMDNPVFLTQNREFKSFRAEINGRTVIVCSTGIGGPSTSIAVEELAQLGIKTFIRIGTSGAIQSHIAVGDIVITTASIRLDGASRHFAPLEFPAVADFNTTDTLKRACETLDANYHLGVTVSTDTFYPGQERYDTFTGRIVRDLRGSMEEWQSMGALNFEMESATLLTLCASSGLSAACIAGIAVNRVSGEGSQPERLEKTENMTIQVVIEAARQLI
ncbi:uridine phosphorylase [Vibrio cholerae]|uniref:uridine phosphorylase n=1 Tax=Vibrio cholerae TaxID=666 RepID=UPI00226EA5E8|nr:uridine phosphorylase [Vibrio cholerae]EKF9435239.1 uridine phosphorylase [Vibrio cholerae]ELJ8545866.1 uridine phosphorylase [Vibrio cholerae]ELJ8749908.1 uridine phosphorylase [Vibrio cholerae]MCX9596666.1 uridine phosphorylase [Vibrio cholerae]HBM4683774.1 uridine phosphorylase [Vibrio cholerae]